MDTDFPFTHLVSYIADDLLSAARSRDLQAAREILASGDVANPSLALFSVIDEDDVDSLEILIGAGCPINESTMTQAASCGSIACLKMLIRAGCPMDEETFFEAAIGYDKPVALKLDCLNLIVQAGCPIHPRATSYVVHMASETGHIECLKTLIQVGLAQEDCLVVQNAASKGHVECVKLLLDAGCSVDNHALTVATRCCGDDNELGSAKTQCLKLLVATGKFDRERGFIDLLGCGNSELLDVLVEAGFPWNRRLLFRQEEYICGPRYNELLICANGWSDEELNSPFARRWIWPQQDLYCGIQRRVDNLKAKKAETDRVVIELFCKILPVDVVKHVLCSYF